MNWKLLKAFPKWFIAFGVFFGSTGLFALWWLTRTPDVQQMAAAPVGAPALPAPPSKQEKAKTLPEKMGWLALVDADLYDISTGELLFRNFIGGIPQRLFYQPETNRLMAQTDRGIIRFAMDGSKDGTLGGDAPPSFTHDGKQATFVKNGDIWVADVDWKGFRYVNERQVTRLGQFSAPFYASNVILESEKAVVVKVHNALLRVDLLTGDVEPITLTLSELSKRRSPDGSFLIGEHNGQIYAYDVNSKDAVMLPKGRDAILDWQWLDNDRCAFIVGGKGVGLFDRRKRALEEVAALPFPCNRISGPSPEGRFVLCASRQGMVTVDVTEKKAELFGTPAQHYIWVSEATLIYSRDTPDKSVRGTWARTIGTKETLVTMDPYHVGANGNAAVAQMPEINLSIFGTKDALYKLEGHSSVAIAIAKLDQVKQTIKPVELENNN